MANEKEETAKIQENHSLRESLARWLLIYPFLFVVGTIDFLIGCVVPFKYRDPSLPPKNTVLSRSTNPADPGSPYRSILGDQLIEHTDPNVCLYDEFQASCIKYKKLKTLGTREIISIDDEIQPNGKTFKKLSLGNYKWATYEEMLRRVDNTSNGLLGLGIKSGQKVVLFAETRPEWLITALACFKIKVTVVTLYSTLGIEALAYGINETKTSFLITSGEQLDKIEAILPKIPSVTHVIVITDNFNEKSMYKFKGKNATPKAIALRDVEFEGSQSVERSFERPTKDDLAVIMYTSGSTGNPKVNFSFRLIVSSRLI
jgi:long-chain acyl-CoA synthetase